MYKKYKQFFQFLCTGGFAALVNIFSRILLSKILSYGLSVIIAYLFAIITAYILAKIYVFKDKKIAIRRSFLAFVFVNLIAIIQTWLVTMLLRNYFFEILRMPEFKDLLAHIIGVCVPVFSSYFGHKYFTFNENFRKNKNF